MQIRNCINAQQLFLLLYIFKNLANNSYRPSENFGQKGLDFMNNSCKTEACVACSVKNCVYHDSGDVCTAGKIQVGNGSASTAKETCCDTFKAK